MDAGKSSQPSPIKNQTSVERKSERGLVVTRTINAPPRIVFEAWIKAELFQRWWVPKSFGLTLLSCEARRARGRRVPPRIPPRCRPGAHGVPRQIPRSDTALASRLDQ